ncbi:MAG TPA: YaiO family outer membrane beta-barrel protein [Burkholderiaceae bacterium]|nr:YaiO family outer membrane beta-barrel protein [Burkholderiaceae bacterium]HMZ02374.1 YaiO family outer membrane beta-barrel protein [Burkholderiaceae bacterium]HNB45361.1 YaiO family outer membrane beta-barrel protein [Burkholderiaceae bacterium]HNG80458.1 YaiO family outer membrane beta-barrel protein [Burkholderiaceae bacterium]
MREVNNKPMAGRSLAALVWAAGWMAGLTLSVSAQAEGLRAPQRASIELVGSQSRLSAGLPNGSAANLRATWSPRGGTLLAAEAMSEKKFGESGGLAGLGVTQDFDERWYGSLTGLGGWGGVNWASQRLDASLARKWGARQQLVTTLGGYRARFGGGRSDSGLRLSATHYTSESLVFDAGIAFNRSQPGAVHSRMPWLAGTYGREGWQYLSLRVAHGSEAWQPLTSGTQIVDFDSTTVSLDWRRWIEPSWGFVLRAEHYRNPSYHRNTLGAGVFMGL